jgi:hypothetical protein
LRNHNISPSLLDDLMTQGYSILLDPLNPRLLGPFIGAL